MTKYDLRILNSAAAPHRKQCLAMLTARALQGAANIKPTNVGGRRLAPSAGAIAPKLGVRCK